MKRSEALIPLSHEHHQALYVTKVIRDLKGEGNSAELFLGYWRDHGQLHARIEEEVLLPGSGLSGPDEDEEVARMLSDHLGTRRMVRRLERGEAEPAEILALAESFADHVRFEERELFPRIERELSGEQLAELGARIEAAEAAGRAAD